MAYEKGNDVDFSLPPIDSYPGGAQTSSSTEANASSAANGSGRPKVVQPTPKALAQRSGPSSILVSPRQKGNPLLKHIKAMPWEYSDMPADYVVGATTCAFFLSIKYHRLHPEYIYNRIRGLQGKYNLRILLTLVDVDDHEEPLKELSKTSLINNVTVILCWSAQEAARYLELYKTYEHANPTSIRGHKSESYSDKMIEFITVPRSINKTDAVGLVSNFGSLRTAINAQPEEVALIAGWGEKKVQRWCTAVREPFRIQKAAKRGLVGANPVASLSRDVSRGELDTDVRSKVVFSLGESMSRPSSAAGPAFPGADRRPAQPVLGSGTADGRMLEEVTDTASGFRTASKPDGAMDRMSTTKGQAGEELSDGVAAALAKLRDQG